MKVLREWRTPRGLAVIGTCGVIVVGVVLLVLAYAGVTFGLGTDKATVVTAVLTFDALLFGAVAAIVALAAYWEASGKPDLSADLWMKFSDKNEPMLLVEPPNEMGMVYASKAPHIYSELVIRNASAYAARNPSVVIKLHGLGVPTSDLKGWEVVTRGNGVGATELVWDGGADRMIHGRGLRKPQWLTFSEAFIIPGGSPAIEVTLFADGTEPKNARFPVRLVDHDEWSRIMKERSGRSAQASTEKS